MSLRCFEGKAQPPSPLPDLSTPTLNSVARSVSHILPSGCFLTTGPLHVWLPLPGKIFLPLSAQLVVLAQLSDQASNITSSRKPQVPVKVASLYTLSGHRICLRGLFRVTV